LNELALFSGAGGGILDRLKAIGNGQVPEVARTAWEILSKWD
tara:strand:- start:648 stop:773 length:126 start_codon:yes stop_codon:yes gene_type:complete